MPIKFCVLQLAMGNVTPRYNKDDASQKGNLIIKPVEEADTKLLTHTVCTTNKGGATSSDVLVLLLQLDTFRPNMQHCTSRSTRTDQKQIEIL